MDVDQRANGVRHGRGHGAELSETEFAHLALFGKSD